MRVITAPDGYPIGTYDRDYFLAGGITGCPDWQADAIKAIEEEFGEDEDLVLLNPRRPSFDVSNSDVSKEQIKWEWDMLCNAVGKLFWFPAETVCPITLFELGTELEYELVVGCHPDYPRRFDIEYQLELRRKDLKVHVGWDDFIAASIDFMKP